MFLLVPTLRYTCNNKSIPYIFYLIHSIIYYKCYSSNNTSPINLLLTIQIGKVYVPSNFIKQKRIRFQKQQYRFNIICQPLARRILPWIYSGSFTTTLLNQALGATICKRTRKKFAPLICASIRVWSCINTRCSD